MSTGINNIGVTFPDGTTQNTAVGSGIGGGGVLQVVSTTYDNTVSSTTNALVDTGLIATITPTSLNSKILVYYSMPFYYATNNSISVQTRLLRGTTTIIDKPTAFNDGVQYPTALENMDSSMIIDQPGTTSPVTYKLQFARSSYAGTYGGTVVSNQSGSTSINQGQLILIELAATGTAGSGGSGALSSGVPQSTTSGTSFDFTNIPPGTKRITMTFTGISTAGASNFLVQIGASTIDNTGYSQYASYQSSIGELGNNTGSTGFQLGNWGATFAHNGSIVLVNTVGNQWVATGTLTSPGGATIEAGTKTLGGLLDRIRLTTVLGTEQFDLGSVNILYETVSTPTAAGASSSGVSFKNRLINGAMVFDQRNAGAAQNSLGLGYVYTLDRWAVYSSVAGKFNSQQNAAAVAPPTGFKNYLGITVASAYTPGANDYNLVCQKIEANNVYDLMWGTSSAVSATVSFWVRSSIAGVQSGFFGNAELTTTFPFTFQINSANTWEYKTFTVPGPTSGTWATGESTGIIVGFNLGNGSGWQTSTPNNWGGTAIQYSSAVSLVGTAGATFYITGVQFEKGISPTTFDYRFYGDELQACQRYYSKSSDVNVVAVHGAAYSTPGMFFPSTSTSYANSPGAVYSPFILFPVVMRGYPTITFINTNLPSSPAVGQWSAYQGTWYNSGTNGSSVTTKTGFMPSFGGTFPAGWVLTWGAWTATAEL